MLIIVRIFVYCFICFLKDFIYWIIVINLKYFDKILCYCQRLFLQIKAFYLHSYLFNYVYYPKLFVLLLDLLFFATLYNSLLYIYRFILNAEDA